MKFSAIRTNIISHGPQCGPQYGPKFKEWPYTDTSVNQLWHNILTHSIELLDPNTLV